MLRGFTASTAGTGCLQPPGTRRPDMPGQPSAMGGRLLRAPSARRPPDQARPGRGKSPGGTPRHRRVPQIAGRLLHQRHRDRTQVGRESRNGGKRRRTAKVGALTQGRLGLDGRQDEAVAPVPRASPHIPPRGVGRLAHHLPQRPGELGAAEPGETSDRLPEDVEVRVGEGGTVAPEEDTTAGHGPSPRARPWSRVHPPPPPAGGCAQVSKFGCPTPPTRLVHGLPRSVPAADLAAEQVGRQPEVTWVSVAMGERLCRTFARGS